MMSPLTAPAWVTQSTQTTADTWFILCIFTDKTDAIKADKGLTKLFKRKKHSDIHITTSLFIKRGLDIIAAGIDPTNTSAPRGQQGTNTPEVHAAAVELDKVITKIKGHIKWKWESLGVVSADEDRDNIPARDYSNLEYSTQPSELQPLALQKGFARRSSL
jgi:hypothetical protein